MISIQIDDKAVVARLGSMNAAVRRALERAVEALAIVIQGKVMRKLTGPVLNERTHRLHDSIHYEMASSPQAVVAVVGTNVEYAAYHEFGFSGAMQVREHLRRITQAFGMPISPRDVLVSAHTRTVRYPERSFLRSTLAEEADAIAAALAEAVNGAVQS